MDIYIDIWFSYVIFYEGYLSLICELIVNEVIKWGF